MKNTTSPRPSRRSVAFELIFVTLLVVFLLVSFFLFIRDNNLQILEQNDSFIQAATVQAAQRINDIIVSSQQDVELMAHLYGSTMAEPTVDEDLLQDMVSRSNFDYVEFISADGMDLTADGQTADLSDREYFQLGMQGKSGKCVVYNSRITNETLLIFYAPFRYDGRIIGVLSCILRGGTMAERLSASYFGVDCSNYLLERDGTVIVATGGSHPENLLASLQERGQLSPEDLEKLTEALDDTNDVHANSFNYKGSNGSGSAYVTTLSGGDWMLVQSFPSSLTKAMTQKAVSAGIRLEIQLAAAFILYLLYLIVKSRSQKKRLVDENREISRIVDTTTQLFSRFALVDFDTDRYEYLEPEKSAAPERGAYTDLIRYLGTKYLSDDGSGTPMTTVIGREYVQQHLTEDVPYLQFEYQIDMDGPRWENISVLCLKRRDGVPTNVLYAIQDVTALKEKEAEIRLALKNASDAAEAANRAKSDFLARMSHDIRTPMNAIMGMTAVAAMHLDDRERLTDCLSKITISSRHLLALINDVLDMSKIESGKVTLNEEPFGMADLVESVVTIIRAQVNAKHQQLKVHIGHIEHEAVIGDTLRLRQVFVNILGNAVKFTPEGGDITFSIRECSSLVHGMGCYEFVCEDTGMGMDEAFLQTIFDPFSRSRDSVSKNIEGAGLGMSITRNIVRMMEGDIRVTSQVGVGSTFTVQVYLKLQDELDDEDMSELADLRVLVADDDEDSCVTTCEILDSIGMASQWVLSGQEAVDRTVAAHGTGEDFAAVILDWKMPGMDGVETARAIREKIGDELPIIILSAYDWSEVEAQARDAGIQAFIEKPLFRSRLVFALRSVLARDSGEKALPAQDQEPNGFAGKRVMLVEDNELNREIAQELLEYIGVEVEQAEDGKMALEKFQVSPAGYYDLIFMDIQMPVMNGYDAARAIRALDRPDAAGLPIIAMTANAFADDIRRCQDAGMNDHVAKPVEMAKLLEAMKKWL